MIARSTLFDAENVSFSVVVSSSTSFHGENVNEDEVSRRKRRKTRTKRKPRKKKENKREAPLASLTITQKS